MTFVMLSLSSLGPVFFRPLLLLYRSKLICLHHSLQALPTNTTHLLRQKPPPSSRLSSPARSLPPYLRSYRSFTRTALLAGGLPAQSSDSESARQSSAGLQVQSDAEKRSSSVSGHRGAREKPTSVQPRSLSAHPAVRSVNVLAPAHYPNSADECACF